MNDGNIWDLFTGFNWPDEIRKSNLTGYFFSSPLWLEIKSQLAIEKGLYYHFNH